MPIRFDLEATGATAPGVLESLNGRLLSLKLSSFYEAAASHEFDCSRLERLGVDKSHKHAKPCTANVLRVLAAKAGFPSLRHARIVCGEQAPVEEAAAALAVLETAGGLHSLHFTSMCPPVGVLAAVAKANPASSTFPFSSIQSLRMNS